MKYDHFGQITVGTVSDDCLGSRQIAAERLETAVNFRDRLLNLKIQGARTGGCTCLRISRLSSLSP
jgi:hypothetical protein